MDRNEPNLYGQDLVNSQGPTKLPFWRPIEHDDYAEEQSGDDYNSWDHVSSDERSAGESTKEASYRQNIVIENEERSSKYWRLLGLSQRTSRPEAREKGDEVSEEPVREDRQGADATMQPYSANNGEHNDRLNQISSVVKNVGALSKYTARLSHYLRAYSERTTYLGEDSRSLVSAFWDLITRRGLDQDPETAGEIDRLRQDQNTLEQTQQRVEYLRTEVDSKQKAVEKERVQLVTTLASLGYDVPSITYEDVYLADEGLDGTAPRESSSIPTVVNVAPLSVSVDQESSDEHARASRPGDLVHQYHHKMTLELSGSEIRRDVLRVASADQYEALPDYLAPEEPEYWLTGIKLPTIKDSSFPRMEFSSSDTASEINLNSLEKFSGQRECDLEPVLNPEISRLSLIEEPDSGNETLSSSNSLSFDSIGRLLTATATMIRGLDDFILDWELDKVTNSWLEFTRFTRRFAELRGDTEWTCCNRQNICNLFRAPEKWHKHNLYGLNGYLGALSMKVQHSSFPDKESADAPRATRGDKLRRNRRELFLLHHSHASNSIDLARPEHRELDPEPWLPPSPPKLLPLRNGSGSEVLPAII